MEYLVFFSYCGYRADSSAPIRKWPFGRKTVVSGCSLNTYSRAYNSTSLTAPAEGNDLAKTMPCQRSAYAQLSASGRQVMI